MPNAQLPPDEHIALPGVRHWPIGRMEEPASSSGWNATHVTGGRPLSLPFPCCAVDATDEDGPTNTMVTRIARAEAVPAFIFAYWIKGYRTCCCSSRSKHSKQRASNTTYLGRHTQQGNLQRESCRIFERSETSAWLARKICLHYLFLSTLSRWRARTG